MDAGGGANGRSHGLELGALQIGGQLAQARGDFDRVLVELYEGIRGGDFHLEPSDDCRWCDFDPVCDKRRKAIRRTKAGAPEAMRVDARREEVR